MLKKIAGVRAVTFSAWIKQQDKDLQSQKKKKKGEYSATLQENKFKLDSYILLCRELTDF